MNLKKWKWQKARPLVKNTRDWLVNHTPASVKKSASNVEENMIKLFEANIDNNIDYKPKKIASAFDEKYIKCKSKGDEKLSIEQYVKTLDHI